MSSLSINKVLSLPSTLAPNTIYFVKVGSEFDLYCTNSLGSLAYKSRVPDGSGSGLDADLLDGQDGSYYLDTSSTSQSKSGGLNISGDVGIGTTSPSHKLEVNGSFAATTKSFVIPHPTKAGYKLCHGSLEGPENGVYVRGQSKESVIHLPEYWTKLIDPDSITVNLTCIGKPQTLWVKEIKDNKVYVESESNHIHYFYTVFAERVDVTSLKVEVVESDI
jgi:hypothetical protein